MAPGRISPPGPEFQADVFRRCHQSRLGRERLFQSMLRVMGAIEITLSARRKRGPFPGRAPRHWPLLTEFQSANGSHKSLDHFQCDQVT